MFSNLEIANHSMLILENRNFLWAVGGHNLAELFSYALKSALASLGATIANAGPKIREWIAHWFIWVCLRDKRDSPESQKGTAIPAIPSFYLWNICGAFFVSYFAFAAFIRGAHQSTLACLKATKGNKKRCSCNITSFTGEMWNAGGWRAYNTSPKMYLKIFNIT